MVEENKLADNEQSKNSFTHTLLLSMFAAMIGTGAQYGYALGVMNAPSEVNIS
jgi:hypothetical protein